MASLTPAVPLRLARTHAAADRGARIAARTVAAGVAAFGSWQAVGVEDGALGTLAGLGLVCLAPSLARGRRRAHRLACALAVLTVLTTAAGTGTGPALWVAIAALIALAACGPAFGVVADPATRRTAIWASTAALAALVADVAHATGVLVHPLVAASLAIAVLLGVRSLRPWRPAPATAAERRRAAALVARYGADSLAPFALRADKRYFFAPGGDAFVAYTVVAGVAVVSGDPVGRSAAFPDLLQDFVAEARRRGWIPAALGLSAARVRDWQALGFNAHYTGDEAIVDPRRFSLEGRSIRKVRQSVTRLERAGYRVEVLRAAEMDEALAAAIAELAERWREGRVETGFSMAYASAAVDRTRDDLYVVGRDADGRVGGFLHLGVVASTRTLSLSSMRRERDTPNGLNEHLICALLAWAREHGYEAVSLNFAAFAKILEPPEAVDLVTRVEQRALRRLSGRFQLERLLRFNAKFDPRWAPRYAAYPSLAALPRIGLAAMLAEAYVARPRWWPG